ncbi:hypothetical protein BH09DEP1_BH09DEP1_0970 [soil metagenome]
MQLNSLLSIILSVTSITAAMSQESQLRDSWPIDIHDPNSVPASVRLRQQNVHKEFEMDACCNFIMACSLISLGGFCWFNNFTQPTDVVNLPTCLSEASKCNECVLHARTAAPLVCCAFGMPFAQQSCKDCASHSRND